VTQRVGLSFISVNDNLPWEPSLSVAIPAIHFKAVSAIAHNKFANVDYKIGFLLGIGGIVGAQFGARLVEHVSTAQFKKIFALVLVALAVYLFIKK